MNGTSKIVVYPEILSVSYANPSVRYSHTQMIDVYVRVYLFFLQIIICTGCISYVTKCKVYCSACIDVLTVYDSA